MQGSWCASAAVAVVVWFVAGGSADAQKVQVRSRVSPAMRALEARTNAAKWKLDNGDARGCYHAYGAIMEEFGINAKLRAAQSWEDTALTPMERDTLYRYAQCADDYAKSVVEQHERYLALDHAIIAYGWFADFERRMDHAPLVQATVLRIAELHAKQMALLEVLTEPPPAEPLAPKEPRQPITPETLPPTTEELFAQRMLGAERFLASGWISWAYASYLALTTDPIGNAHPDVAWGMARSSELMCAGVDDAKERLRWIREALQWYARYLELEYRPQYMTGAMSRTTVAQTLTTELTTRATQLDHAITLAAVPVAAVATVDTVVVPPPLDSAPPPSDARLEDPKERAARKTIAAMAPEVLAAADANPQVTYGEILAQLICFKEHGMARRTFREYHGRLAFVYDNFPPFTTACPPEDD